MFRGVPEKSTLLILFLLAIVAILNIANAAEPVAATQPKIRLRFVSLSNKVCTACSEALNHLTQNKNLAATSNPAAYKGKMLVENPSAKNLVEVELYHFDRPEINKVWFDSPLSTQFIHNNLGMAQFPVLQIFVDGTLYMHGSFSDLATALNVELTGANYARFSYDVMYAFVNQKLKSNTSPILPIRLQANDKKQFYKLSQICEHTKNIAPSKNALVVLKTHYCDNHARVCLRTSALVSDPANKFVHDNFVVYDTRFAKANVLFDQKEEATIRKAWNKPDEDPEYLVIDTTSRPNSCEIIHRKYAKNYVEYGLFATQGALDDEIDFNTNYIGLRTLILDSPRVTNLLKNKYDVRSMAQIEEELEAISQLRTRSKQNSKPTLQDIFNAMKAANL